MNKLLFTFITAAQAIVYYSIKSVAMPNLLHIKAWEETGIAKRIKVLSR
ncbi:hypothetical protein HMPREF0663_10805 [Hoylesella oralis ATCC 33269]|jgi:hypothetical protein|uniref:Uncharacterized protein n=1 Tax=Hoylesella oralis ATCC 33269 TaxID=873533 RepID=E7RNQ4_9BACT|nr:hypothetical protein [Hoylesella oralis]EFZ37347.1 hypothetical protein HMPREF0663_10805 [Hoylesella oralis ATCC 33269]EPH14929.1 hypothetical protein HMPREF1475_02323 [Hoylesella oralis HGA0225]SHG08606.1 hypothetical protein SAMN05444288_2326 [Hoylesella oralis]